MARKKNNTKTIAIVIILVVLGLWYFNSGDDGDTKPFGLIEVPIESGVRQNSYVCPTGNNVTCFVTGEMDCTLKDSQGVPVVISRTDNGDYASGWIALDNPLTSAQDLQVYCEYGTYQNNFVPQNPINLSGNPTAYYTTAPSSSACTNNRCIFILISGTTYRRYSSSVSCSYPITATDPTPLIGGVCGIYEVCEGESNQYSCTGQLKKGNTVLTSVDYNNQNQGFGIKTNQVTITGGEIVDMLGGDANRVIYNSRRIIDVCVENDVPKNQCSGDFSIKICNSTSNQLNLPVTCDSISGSGSVCTIDSQNGARCTTPIEHSDEKFYLDNSETSGYKPSEPIEFRAKFRTTASTVPSVSTKIYIINTNNGEKVSGTEQTRLVSLSSTSKEEKCTFNKLPRGDYKVVVEMTYLGDKKVTPNIEKTFKVDEPLDLEIRYFNHADDRFLPTSGYQVEVLLKVSESGVAYPINPALTRLTVKQGSTPLPNPTTFRGYSDDLGKYQIYEYIFTTTASESSVPLYADAYVESDNGLNGQESYKEDLLPGKIKVEITNAGTIPSQLEPGSYTIYFTTKDPLGNLIETTNVLTLDKQGQKTETLPSTIIQGSGGSYSFTYNFQIETTHSFHIFSSKPPFISESEDIDPINVQKGGSGFGQCVDNSGCDPGEICDNRTCKSTTESNIFNYGLIILGAGVVILLVIIYFMSQRKKSEVGNSISGL